MLEDVPQMVREFEQKLLRHKQPKLQNKVKSNNVLQLKQQSDCGQSKFKGKKPIDLHKVCYKLVRTNYKTLKFRRTKET